MLLNSYSSLLSEIKQTETSLVAFVNQVELPIIAKLTENYRVENYVQYLQTLVA
jgi:hypothetical protein